MRRPTYQRSWLALCIAVLAIFVASCGGPPTAKEILQRPASSGLKDAHATLIGHFTSGAFSLDVTGDAVFVVQPKSGSDLRLQGSLGALPIAIEYLSVGGKDYQRVGSDKWTEQASKGSAAGASSWSDARDATFLGEESLPLGKAWHVKATTTDGSPFELWVRENDGYPLKYTATMGQAGTITLTFDRFNTGASITPPGPSDIKPAPKNVTGTVGGAMQLSNATVTVVSVDLNFVSGNEFAQPKAGNRFIAVEILYENTGSDKISYNPFDWKLSDSSGFSYDQSFVGGKEPSLHSGDLQIGEKARGFVTFEVPQSASGLVLKSSLGDDTMNVPIS